MKTVLFTISNIGVFKNLFFFPESVFGYISKYLSANSDLRVVFLLPPGFKDKYRSFFAPYKSILGDKIVFETVKVDYPRSTLERLFYFFYSYLLYTGTTKMLATMGLRPDEPPAGGRRYLAPVKWLIAQVFGRSRMIKLKLVPKLFNWVFKDAPFQKIIAAYRPEAAFISHVYGVFDTRLLEECRQKGVRTIGMAVGWDHLDKYYLPFKLDRLLAQSVHIKEMAELYQLYKPSSVAVTGYPHLDFVSNLKYAMSRPDLLSHFKFPPGAKFLLYISGSAYCPDEPDIIEKIISWIEDGRFGPNMYLIIRPYLGGRGADREFDKKKFMKFEEHPRVAFYSRESWSDLEQSMLFMNIMRHADVIISIFTSALLESVVFDRPILGIGFDGYTTRPIHRSIKRFAMSEHFKEVVKTGALPIANNFDELHKMLLKYLTDPRLDEDKRKILRDTLLFKLDGLASRRIVAEIFSFIGLDKSIAEN